MRVLHLVKTNRGARFALIQMRELVRRGVEVHVALPPGGPREPDYVAAGINVHPFDGYFSAGSPHRLPSQLREFRRLVTDVDPDLIHSHFVSCTLTMRLALRQHRTIPRIFQVAGPLHLETPISRELESRTATSVDHWFGACEWTCNCYRSMGKPRERVRLMYYGKDLESFGADAVPGKLRAELGIPDDRKIVGMVALMYPPRWYVNQKRGIKGHEDLIEALRIVDRRGYSVQGVFVGGNFKDGHRYEQELQAHGQNLLGDRATFLGTRYDVVNLYPDFDIAVHPSHSDNVGGATESMLLGVPTIATSVGGFPDAIKQDVTGKLVPPRSPECLAEAIIQMLDDPVSARCMAVRGRELMEQMADARRNARKVHEAYQDILLAHG